MSATHSPLNLCTPMLFLSVALPSQVALLLEQGVLCVLPMLCAALLFSEAGGDVGTCRLPAASPEGKGREKKRWRERSGKCQFDRKYSILSQSFSSGGFYFHTTNALGDRSQSTAEDATILCYLSIAMHVGKTVLFFS